MAIETIKAKKVAFGAHSRQMGEVPSWKVAGTCNMPTSHSRYLRLGVGFGGRMYVNNAKVRQTDSKFGVPVFAAARGNFISAYDRDGVPFWSVRLGGIIKEGIYFSPSVGYSFGGIRNNFQVGIAYDLINPKDFTGDRRIYSGFSLRLGYEF